MDIHEAIQLSPLIEESHVSLAKIDKAHIQKLERVNMSDILDSVIDSIPVSFFHYRLLIMCGLAFMADAMEVSLLTILGTCAGMSILAIIFHGIMFSIFHFISPT